MVEHKFKELQLLNEGLRNTEVTLNNDLETTKKELEKEPEYSRD